MEKQTRSPGLFLCSTMKGQKTKKSGSVCSASLQSDEQLLKRQPAVFTSCFLLQTFVRAPWLARWPTPRHSWSTPSSRPAPGCEARKWSFHPGCRPQSGAGQDVSPSHVTISQHPAAHDSHIYFSLPLIHLIVKVKNSPGLSEMRCFGPKRSACPF